MELTCPCGNGDLIRKVTTKGPNIHRPYYKCPGSNKDHNTIDCKFYSFEDELKYCRCGRGLCCTVFQRDKNLWRCCVMGDGDCGFSMTITSTRQPYSSSIHPAQSWSPPTPPAQSQSSKSPSNSQGRRSNVMRERELLVRSLEVAQSSSAAYLDLIKEFAGCRLEDER